MLTYQGARCRACIMRARQSLGRTRTALRAHNAGAVHIRRTHVRKYVRAQRNSLQDDRNKREKIIFALQFGWCRAASGRPLMREVITAGAN